ncbi:unnamed protein product [Rotaria magnacalcarata]|uniref:Pentatricopeptide repeat-containing protein n=1 Tax=Rotaria magnacalcarata TaxID=392030 RepID=A0A816AIV3_9BILA|nr:unnamed protein product [Rotaria magnacalcarata]
MKIGKELLAKMPENYRSHNITSTSAINMLMKFGDVESAARIFRSIKAKDIITYGAMVKGYVENEMFEKALDLFEQIHLSLTNVIYTIVFNACALLNNNRAMKIGKKLLAEMPENYRNDNITSTAAIDMLMKFGDVESAERIFRSMKTKNIITYGAMVKGYVGNEMFEKALDLFEQIHLSLTNITYTIAFNCCAKLCNDRAMKIGKKLLAEMPENYRNHNITSTAAIDMLMKFGDDESAERIFRSIKAKDIITYNAMIKGYVGTEMFDKALDLFEQIDIELDDVTYTIAFNCCAKLCNDRAMKIGKELLAKMPENYRNHNITSTSAIDMLMKFGDVESAERIFRSIKAKSTNIYGALMNGYNRNGESWKCFKVFEEMNEKDIIPDEIGWNILIGACSKSGMLHHCQYIVNQIPLNIQNKIRTQTALIDMWGKCGSIENAKNVFNLVVDRDTITYTAMINAFALNGMGTQAVELYREMPNNLRDHVSQICVLNACSHAGLLHEARTIFNEISLKTESIITAMVDCLSRLFMFDEVQKLIEDYEKTNTPSIVMYS